MTNNIKFKFYFTSEVLLSEGGFDISNNQITNINKKISWVT